VCTTNKHSPATRLGGCFCKATASMTLCVHHKQTLTCCEAGRLPCSQGHCQHDSLCATSSLPATQHPAALCLMPCKTHTHTKQWCFSCFLKHSAALCLMQGAHTHTHTHTQSNDVIHDCTVQDGASTVCLKSTVPTVQGRCHRAVRF